MEHIHIRQFTSDDYQEICRLDAPMFESMGGYVLFRHIQELFGNLFFVAEETNTKTLVGYILGGVHLDDQKTGKLIRIGVAKSHQRMECGTKLCNALFTEMKRFGVEKVHLTVAETNTAAIFFYKKIGFVNTQRIENYFYPDIPRLVFEKKL